MTETKNDLGVELKAYEKASEETAK